MCVPDYEILQEYNLTSRDDSEPLETELRLEGLISDPVGPNSGRGTNSGSNDRQFIFIGVNGRKRPCENPKVRALGVVCYFSENYWIMMVVSRRSQSWLLKFIANLVRRIAHLSTL